LLVKRKLLPMIDIPPNWALYVSLALSLVYGVLGIDFFVHLLDNNEQNTEDNDPDLLRYVPLNVDCLVDGRCGSCRYTLHMEGEILLLCIE
jgi:hypothetical protein